jgi:hypothetical protein
MAMMRDILSNERLEERLWQILDRCDPRDRLYVYRIENDQPVRPALFKGRTFPGLLDCLRDEHGGGKFRLLIRRADKMILSGTIGIARPLKPRVP